MQYGESIRAARAGDALLLYVPTSAPLALHGDWSGYTATAIQLDGDGRTALSLAYREGVTELEMHPYYDDALIVLEKA